MKLWNIDEEMYEIDQLLFISLGFILDIFIHHLICFSFVKSLPETTQHCAPHAHLIQGWEKIILLFR